MAGAQTSMAYNKLQEEMNLLRGLSDRTFYQIDPRSSFGLVPEGFVSSALGSISPGLSGYHPDYSGMTQQRYSDEINRNMSSYIDPNQNDMLFSIGMGTAGLIGGGLPGGLVGLTVGGMLDLTNAITGTRVRERESLAEGLRGIGARNFGNMSRAASREMADKLQYTARSPEGRRLNLDLDIIQENVLSFDAAGGFSEVRTPDEMDRVLEGVVKNTREFANKFRLRQSEAVQIMAELQSQMIMHTDQMGEFSTKMARFSGITGMSPVAGVQLGMQGVDMLKGVGVAPDVAFNMTLEARLQAERLSKADPETRMLVNSFGGTDAFAVSQINQSHRYLTSTMGNLNIMGMLGGANLADGLTGNLIGAGDFLSSDPFNLLRMQARNQEFLGVIGIPNAQAMMVNQVYSAAVAAGQPTDEDALAGLASFMGIATPQEFKAALAGTRDTLNRDLSAEAASNFNDSLLSRAEEGSTHPGNWFRQITGNVSDAFFRNSIVSGIAEASNSWSENLNIRSTNAAARRRGLTVFRSQAGLYDADLDYFNNNREYLLGRERELRRQVSDENRITAYSSMSDILDGYINRSPEELVDSPSLDLDFASYAAALAHRESSNIPENVNSLGFSGLYQMGTEALEDAGFIKRGTSERFRDTSLSGRERHIKLNSALEDPDNWTGVYNIESLDDFLANREAQTHALKLFTDQNERYLENHLGAPLSELVNSQDRAGYLMAAHLGGHSGAANLYRGRETQSDIFGTSLTHFFELGKSTQSPSTLQITYPLDIPDRVEEALLKNEITEFSDLTENFNSGAFLDVLNAVTDAYSSMPSLQVTRGLTPGMSFKDLSEDVKLSVFKTMEDLYGEDFTKVLNLQNEAVEIYKANVLEEALEDNRFIKAWSEQSEAFSSIILDKIPYMSPTEIESFESLLKSKTQLDARLPERIVIRSKAIDAFLPSDNNEELVTVLTGNFGYRESMPYGQQTFEDFERLAEESWEAIRRGVVSPETTDDKPILRDTLLKAFKVESVAELPKTISEMTPGQRGDFLTAYNQSFVRGGRYDEEVATARLFRNFNPTSPGTLSIDKAYSELLTERAEAATSRARAGVSEMYSKIFGEAPKPISRFLGVNPITAAIDTYRVIEGGHPINQVYNFLDTHGREGFRGALEDHRLTARLNKNALSFLNYMGNIEASGDEDNRLGEIFKSITDGREYKALSEMQNINEISNLYGQMVNQTLDKLDLEDPELTGFAMRGFKQHLDRQLSLAGTFRVNLPKGENVPNFLGDFNNDFTAANEFSQRMRSIQEQSVDVQRIELVKMLEDIKDSDVRENVLTTMKDMNILDQEAFNFLTPQDFTVPGVMSRIGHAIEDGSRAIRVVVSNGEQFDMEGL